jgi:hypothetical protein
MRAAGVFVAMLALLLYVTAYVVLANPKEYGVAGVNIYCYERVPSYRVGGPTARCLFSPMEWFDRRIRPTYWNGCIKVYTPDLCKTHEME